MGTSNRKAYIYVRNDFAGILKETDEGYSFVYDEEYLNNPSSSSISLTLQKQKEEFFSKTLFAFFDGLIPEGWLLDILVSNWKLDQRDRFGILLVACNDCIGNVSVRRERLWNVCVVEKN